MSKRPDLPDPPTAEPDGDQNAIALYRERELPVERAMLWYPVNGEAVEEEPGSFPLFIPDEVLREIAMHLREDSLGECLGFLIGQLYRCPLTHTRYLIADATVPAAEGLRGDRTLLSVAMSWPRLQAWLRRRQRHVLGWYHTHPDGHLGLSTSDVSTHLRFFPQSWQSALLFRPGERSPEGIVCRPSTDHPMEATLLPFYELFESEAALRARRERGGQFAWQGYRSDGAIDEAVEAQLEGSTESGPKDETDGEVGPTEQDAGSAGADELAFADDLGFDDDDALSTPVSARPPGSLASDRSRGAGRARGDEGERVILPDAFDAAREENGGLWTVGGRRSALGSFARFGIPVAAVVLLLIGGLAAWKLVLSPSQPAQPAIEAAEGPVDSQPTPQTPPGATRIEQLAAGVEEAVLGYQERARLFDSRRMTCADLGRGLTQVDEAWARYNVGKRSRITPLGPQAQRRDEALYRDVREVEQHFAASGCPRP